MLSEWAKAEGIVWDSWPTAEGDAFASRYESYITDPGEEPDPTKWETEVLIRWMIKTAVVFERSIPKGNNPVVPNDARAMARNGITTQDFFLALGRIEIPGFTAHLTKGFPIWNGGVYHKYQVHSEGFSFAVYLNHLAMRMVRCPHAEPGVKSHVRTAEGVPVVPFWIVPKTCKYDRLVHHAFPTFEWFMDALEIYTGHPRRPLATTRRSRA